MLISVGSEAPSLNKNRGSSCVAERRFDFFRSPAHGAEVE